MNCDISITGTITLHNGIREKQTTYWTFDSDLSKLPEIIKEYEQIYGTCSFLDIKIVK